MASLKKTKVIDPTSRVAFSMVDSVRRRVETARVIYEDAHRVPYTLGEIAVLTMTAWLDQDADVAKAVKALTPDQVERIERAMGGQSDA
jgi:hypothetical protein